MEIAPCQFTDYKPCATPSVLVEAFLSRVSHVYSGGENMRNVLTGLLTPYVEIEQVMCGLLDRFEIDSATTDQLEIVGLFLGLPRTVCNTFRPDVSDRCNLKASQLRDYTFTDDNEYKKFLTATSYALSFDGTLKAYERILQYVFDDIALDDETTTRTTRILTHGGGLINIGVFRELTDEELRRAELYKFVLPYYGSTRVTFLYGADFFRFNTDPATGLCRPFPKRA